LTETRAEILVRRMRKVRLKAGEIVEGYGGDEIDIGRCPLVTRAVAHAPRDRHLSHSRDIAYGAFKSVNERSAIYGR
jgi:hypothetical protein